MEVHRVRNDKAMADYENYKRSVHNKRGGNCTHLKDAIISRNAPSVLASNLDARLNEYLMFHGTSPAAAKGITETDFRLPKDHAHGAIYGAGVYIAETNTKAHMYCSPDSRGWVPILIVRTLLGSIHNTEEERPDGNALLRSAQRGDYDSVCGDRRKLTWNFSGWREFIVYDHAAAVAEWIVWCKPK